MNSFNSDFEVKPDQTYSVAEIMSSDKCKSPSRMDYFNKEMVLPVISKTPPTAQRPQPQRARKQLSKFTISSRNSTSPLCHNNGDLPLLVPAYRQCNNESLPTVALPKDTRKGNSITFSSRTPLLRSELGVGVVTHSPLTSSSNPENVKHLYRLQRRSFHRSLDNLTSSRTETDHSFPRRVSWPSLHHAASTSDPLKRFPEMTTLENGTSLSSNRVSPGEITAECKTAVTATATANQKRRELMYRVIISLVCQSMKRKSLEITELRHQLEQRNKECAARMIRHHMLLNSWRLTKDRFTMITLENNQMHKTLENQTLQLNIKRKMESLGKKNTLKMQRDYDELQLKYGEVIKINEEMKKDYALLLAEKNSVENLIANNMCLKQRLDEANSELDRLENDRLRVDMLAQENEELSSETAVARCQITELVEQCSDWQEKAHSFQTGYSELKLQLKNKEEQFQRILKEKITVSQENEALCRSCNELRKAVDEYSIKLSESGLEQIKMETSYNECRKERDELKTQMQDLSSSIAKYRKNNLEISEKLYLYAARNVQRRRVWGVALYFLVKPFDAFQRMIYGAPQPHRPSSPQQSLKQNGSSSPKLSITDY